MNKKQIKDFIEFRLFNPAKGINNNLAKKVISVASVAIICMSITITAVSLSEEKNVRMIEFILLSVIIFLSITFYTMSIHYLNKDRKYGYYKSIILLEFQLLIVASWPYIMNLDIHGINGLLIRLPEGTCISIMFFLITYINVKKKINKGYFRATNIQKLNKLAKPNFNHIGVIGMISYVVATQVGGKNVEILGHVAFFVFNTPIILLTITLMQLYYAKKYSLMYILTNASFENA